MPASSPPSVVILGTDAVLAARPATAVQLAHACLKAGYRSAIPASWGDELLATEALHHLADPGRAPTAVYCVCPLVVGRLGAIAQDPTSNVVALVSPPLATARYVRALAGEAKLHVTYVGGCPDAADREIDARFTPTEFLQRLAALGIDPANEPLVFDSILPADRRRFRSLPGGVPSAETLWSEGGARALAELDQPDFVADLAQRFLSRERTLIDVATRLGCVCSGAAEGVPPLAARAAVTALEPPRATNSVVDESLDIPLLRRLPRPRTPAFAMTGISSSAAGAAAAGASSDEPVSETAAGPGGAITAAENGHGGGAVRLEAEPLAGAPALEIPEAPSGQAGERSGSPAGVPVAASGPEGRTLPRAYLLRRRTPRGGVRVVEPSAREAPERSVPIERERAIRSNVEPRGAAHEEPPRAAQAERSIEPHAPSRVPIITGPVERPHTAPPPIVAPPVIAPPVIAPPDVAAPAPDATWHSPLGAARAAAPGAPAGSGPAAPPGPPRVAETGRRPDAEPGAAPRASGTSSPMQPSATAALLDAWVRLSRERPLLQLGAMLTLALVFGLLFAALFAVAGGDDGRSSAPRADSAAVAGEAAPAPPPAADTTAGASSTRGETPSRRRESAARATPAPATRAPAAAPERAATRPPVARPRPTPTVTPPVPAPVVVPPRDTVDRVQPTPIAADSAVAARPSAADSAALARAREIEALREEFARRRARLDSIDRAIGRNVDSISPAPPPAGG